MKNTETVLVLGASTDPNRYSNMAVKELMARGHRVVPIHPEYASIEGQKCFPSLDAAAHEYPHPFDTLTVYVNQRISTTMEAEILRVKPRRVIFNPGSENRPLIGKLKKAGMQVLEACTLVLLRTNQF